MKCREQSRVICFKNDRLDSKFASFFASNSESCYENCGKKSLDFGTPELIDAYFPDELADFSKECTDA